MKLAKLGTVAFFTLAFTTVSHASDAERLAALEAKLTQKGVHTQARYVNFDGSFTIELPKLSYDGWLQMISFSSREELCRYLDADLVGADEKPAVELRNVLRLKFNGLNIHATPDSGWGDAVYKITCRESQGPKLAATMEELLKTLKDVNGIEVRDDGSVVIDTKIAKRIQLTGDGHMVVHASGAGATQSAQ